MRKYLPFALLIPALGLLGIFLASHFGAAPPYGTPLNSLLGAAAWTLLFLIVYGNARRWRSVRIFLIIFVVGKFAAIFYYQLFHDLRIDKAILNLAGAILVSSLLFALFWPRPATDHDSG